MYVRLLSVNIKNTFVHRFFIARVIAFTKVYRQLTYCLPYNCCTFSFFLIFCNKKHTKLIIARHSNVSYACNFRNFNICLYFFSVILREMHGVVIHGSARSDYSFSSYTLKISSFLLFNLCHSFIYARKT